MKKYLMHLMGVMMLTLFCSAVFTACSDDDAESSSVDSGTWYLTTYGTDSYEGYTCSWGEYISFSGNKLHWNNRNDGNTTYSYTISDNTIYLTNGPISNYTFKIESHSSKTLKLKCSDGMRRRFSR